MYHNGVYTACSRTNWQFHLPHSCRSPTVTRVGVAAVSSASYNLNPKIANLTEDTATVPTAVTVWDLQIYKYDTVSTFCNTLYYMDYITLVYKGVRTTSRMKSRLQNLTAGWKSTAHASCHCCDVTYVSIYSRTPLIRINWGRWAIRICRKSG